MSEREKKITLVFLWKSTNIIENKTYLQIYIANSFLVYDLKFWVKDSKALIQGEELV